MRQVDPDTHELLNLSPDQETRWQADLDTLCREVEEHERYPLRIGDQYRELKKRWGNKAAVLAREAGISPYVARQRARVAAAIPVGSELRSMALPYSILRLLAPLPDPEPWALQARALQQRGELRVRQFARLLEDAGLRRRRPRRPPLLTCLHCRCSIEAHDPAQVYVRVTEGHGWFCHPRCAVEHLCDHAGLAPEVQWVPADDTPIQNPKSEIQNQQPPPDAEKRDSVSPAPPPDAEKRDSASPPTPGVQRTEEGTRCVLPGGLVVMTRRRSK